MPKTGETFQLGDFVYAKVKGHCDWPAEIHRVLPNNTYEVYFFGTEETARLKNVALHHYDETSKEKFNTSARMKRIKFSTAVEQIEEAIRNDIVDDENGNYQKPAANTKTHVKPVKIEKEKPNVVMVRKKRTLRSNLDESSEELPIAKRTRTWKTEPKSKVNIISVEIIKPADTLLNQTFDLPNNNHQIEDNSNDNSPMTHEKISAAKIEAIRAQLDLLNCSNDIRKSLNLSYIDVDTALNHLKQMKTSILPNVNQMMLLKYPDILKTFGFLRVFRPEILSDLETKVGRINALATEIYDGLKALFGASDNETFKKVFETKSKEIEEKTRDLGGVTLFETMTLEELDQLATTSDNVSKDADSEGDNVPYVHADRSLTNEELQETFGEEYNGTLVDGETVRTVVVKGEDSDNPIHFQITGCSGNDREPEPMDYSFDHKNLKAITSTPNVNNRKHFDRANSS